jgi:hypothetical protein
MRTAAWHKGHSWGWDLAGKFATASRGDKRAILRRLQHMADSFNPFVVGAWAAINDRSEARYDARRAGLDVRRVRTHRLAEAVERLA